jgi:hypothetical protein
MTLSRPAFVAGLALLGAERSTAEGLPRREVCIDGAARHAGRARHRFGDPPAQEVRMVNSSASSTCPWDVSDQALRAESPSSPPSPGNPTSKNSVQLSMGRRPSPLRRVVTSALAVTTAAGVPTRLEDPDCSA